MFEKITPEQAGISSKCVLDVLKRLEEAGLVTHSLLLLKGDKIFGEFYWKPFHNDFNHRQYSQTKSFVGIAVGLLEQEGKVDLNKPIISYFPEKIDGELHEYMKDQTVQDMLNMTTCVLPEYWFDSVDTDRTHLYFSSKNVYRPSGTVYKYDSAGSQVLCALVEKLSGKSLLEYLNDRLFSHMGTFKNAQVLKTRNGDSWGDSALICTSRDMASMARLLLNGGEWQGKQLINSEYVYKSTHKQVDNCTDGFTRYDSHGYSNQIFITKYGFKLNGMGCQFTFGVPEKDLIIVINSDNQGLAGANAIIHEVLESGIIRNMQTTAIKENKSAYKKLNAFANKLQLRCVEGQNYSSFQEEINGKIFVSDTPDAPFKKFSLSFNKNVGVLKYENATGKKSLRFGLCRNEFGKFPELGYSNDVGGQRTTDGFTYDCAVSGAWREQKKFMIKVQVIDRYFGNFVAIFGFKGNKVAVKLQKTAEDFFKEYQGEFVATMK